MESALRNLSDSAQRAAGVIAAKHRGDHPGAEALLASFADESAKASGFCALAELALALVRHESGQSMDELVQELNLLIEATMAAGPPPA